MPVDGFVVVGCEEERECDGADDVGYYGFVLSEGEVHDAVGFVGLGCCVVVEESDERGAERWVLVPVGEWS